MEKNNVFSFKKAQEIKRKKEELKQLTKNTLSKHLEEDVFNLISIELDKQESHISNAINYYSNAINYYSNAINYYEETIDILLKKEEELSKVLNRVAHTSNKLTYKEMLYIDFLDLKNSNDGKTYDEFKNYIEIVKKNPQIDGDLDVFMEAVGEIEYFHLDGDFFENEYSYVYERTDGLSIESDDNDFKRINDELKAATSSVK